MRDMVVLVIQSCLTAVRAAVTPRLTMVAPLYPNDIPTPSLHTGTEVTWAPGHLGTLC